MTSDRQTLAQLRAQARQARDNGCFAAAARLEHQAAESARALNLAGEQTRALLWEGYSLRHAGDDDVALAILLQVVGERAATADPSDVFSALIAVVHISLDRKPARFCRALLDQARRYTSDHCRQWSSAPLDFLEGEFAYRRGESATAWDRYSRAWAAWRNEHPRLTPATHLWALCRTAFRHRNLAELAQCTEKLAELHSLQAPERRLAQRAYLLHWRAQRVVDASLTAFKPEPLATALNLLAVTADHAQGDCDSGARREALQTLALLGRWADVDAALSQFPLPTEPFDSALCLGDLALNRARTMLDLPPVDDDYGEEDTAPYAPSTAPAAMTLLREAERCYQAALLPAAAEDERLETDRYGNIVRERQQRCGRIMQNVFAYSAPAMGSN